MDESLFIFMFKLKISLTKGESDCQPRFNREQLAQEKLSYSFKRSLETFQISDW